MFYGILHTPCKLNRNRFNWLWRDALTNRNRQTDGIGVTRAHVSACECECVPNVCALPSSFNRLHACKTLPFVYLTSKATLSRDRDKCVSVCGIYRTKQTCYIWSGWKRVVAFLLFVRKVDNASNVDARVSDSCTTISSMFALYLVRTDFCTS